MTIVTCFRPSGKGRVRHVTPFSEAHHNWAPAASQPRSRISTITPTPTDTPSRCVPTTTLSAARRSTLARCVYTLSIFRFSNFRAVRGDDSVRDSTTMTPLRNHQRNIRLICLSNDSHDRLLPAAHTEISPYTSIRFC